MTASSYSLNQVITEEEKERIRRTLLKKGRELFIQYGFSKTSIDEIVNVCGIAKGSFYKFFSSKEELFYVILKNEEHIRDQLLGELLKEDRSPKEMIASFFLTSLQIVDENPILQMVFQEGKYDRILRRVPKEMVEVSSKADLDTGIEMIKGLIKKGFLQEDDPEVIVGMMKLLMMMRLHKNELGDLVFQKVMEKLINFVAEGLTKKE